jgi:hypothetical protein
VNIRRDLKSEPQDGSRVPSNGWARPVTAQLRDLEGAHDTSRIPEVGRACERRSNGRKTSRKPFDAFALELLFDPRPNRRVARERVGIDASCDGAEVEAGAADKDRDAAADGQVAKHSGGMRDEVRDAERRVRFDEVEAMVRNEGAFGDGRLGRPDVESKKDLPGIGRDDLDGSVWRREGVSELDGERRLAGRRCTGDHDEWRRAGHDRAMR